MLWISLFMIFSPCGGHRSLEVADLDVNDTGDYGQRGGAPATAVPVRPDACATRASTRLERSGRRFRGPKDGEHRLIGDEGSAGRST
jgi:hypothetical protein